MIRLTLPAAIALCLLATRPAAAQDDIFGGSGSAWGPRLDSIHVAAASRTIWRGYDLGTGLRAALAVGIWGRSVTAAGPWSVSATAAGTMVDPRGTAPLGTHANAALEVARLLGVADAQLRGWTGGYLASDPPGGSGGEFGLALEELPIPWLPEVWPTLQVGVIRAAGPLRGTYLSTSLRQSAGLQQLAARLEVGADWNDVGRSGFGTGRLRGDAGVSVGLGRSRWKLNVDGGLLRASGATLGWVGAGTTWQY